MASLLSCQINGSSSGAFTTLVGREGERGGRERGGREGEIRRGGGGMGRGKRRGSKKMEIGGVDFKLSETINWYWLY